MTGCQRGPAAIHARPGPSGPDDPIMEGRI